MSELEVKRTFLKRGRRWMNNIKIHRKEVGWGGDLDWICLPPARDMCRAVVNL